MVQLSRPWNGTTEGDAGPYSADQWKRLWETLFVKVPESRGVIADFEDELEVTESAANIVSVATGAAMVKGCWYESDEVVSFSVPTPTGSTRVDRIVLRCTWSGTGSYPQTVRLRKLTGVEGGGTPALTQVDGTTWEIPLAYVSITTGGVMTITDERAYAQMVSTKMIEDGAVTEDKLDAGATSGGSYCTVYKADGDTSVPSSSTYAIPFTSELEDPSAMHNNAVNPSRVYIVTPGVYVVSTSIVWNTEPSGERYLGVRVNGTRRLCWHRHPPGDRHMSVAAVTPFMAAGAYVEAVVQQNSGAPLNLQAASTDDLYKQMMSVTWVNAGT